MKRFCHLFEQICSFENLLLAAQKAQRGKRFKHSTSEFNLNLEKNLLCLQQELMGQTYKMGGYRQFYIYDPKKRLISAAPYRDRVVQHALCNCLSQLDHYLKENIQCRYYLRYMDDLVIFGNDKQWLNIVRAIIRKEMAKLKLILHENKSQVYLTHKGVSFLGYKVWSEHHLRQKLKMEISAGYARGISP